MEYKILSVDIDSNKFRVPLHKIFFAHEFFKGRKDPYRIHASEKLDKDKMLSLKDMRKNRFYFPYINLTKISNIYNEYVKKTERICFSLAIKDDELIKDSTILLNLFKKLEKDCYYFDADGLFVIVIPENKMLIDMILSINYLIKLER